MDPTKVESEYIRFVMNIAPVRAAVEMKSATTAGNIGISGKILKEIEIPVPPLPEQRRIVAYLNEFHSRVNGVARLQATTAAGLEALLPAILDRAFRGGSGLLAPADLI
jgi:type I restriction enzyme S subunit